ncbi:right-handed parallel beta-helix repeat-containing protein [Crenothrix polyspora]|uniref:Uncharacterized protein n=1 Tax=Crenothrix polyspora TaxID=360316 RepID=A0A1R4HAL4_9GAMM|nr:right-handed parallel beta-helix repeat-containing protein [Crenothrix polyspora]SJM92910.1 exported hypothetical protein [Crenothrix polyspora]
MRKIIINTVMMLAIASSANVKAAISLTDNQAGNATVKPVVAKPIVKPIIIKSFIGTSTIVSTDFWPPFVIVPTRIDASTPNPRETFLNAIRGGVQSVELCNVNINLTGIINLELHSNQSITAAAGCERSLSNKGSSIYVTDKREGGVPLFLISENNVKISGFRLYGPNRGIGAGGNNRETGIKIEPKDNDPTLPGNAMDQQLKGIEISNMELYYWSGAAVNVIDNNNVYPQGRLTFANASGVTIKQNYIHHNRHYAGFGYGVSVGKGAYAFIQGNVFDENRHAIAGESHSDDGIDFSGYILRDNLVLSSGGLHCTEKKIAGKTIVIFAACWQTHQIDMHGDESTLLGGEHCCGTAGGKMVIEQNTILYHGGWGSTLGFKDWENGYAIKIRGNPKESVTVDANVFFHGDEMHAIKQNGDRNLLVTPNNVYGVNPSEPKNLVQCDFDGDGRQDDFMATGITWWARSAVNQQWRYLNTKTEKPGSLIIKDFDGDGKCDVALKPRNPTLSPQKYAKNGIGDWTNLIVLR